MEISKAKKLQREAQMKIDEILNVLSKETECHLRVDVDTAHMMSAELPTYMCDIPLMV